MTKITSIQPTVWQHDSHKPAPQLLNRGVLSPAARPNFAHPNNVHAAAQFRPVEPNRSVQPTRFNPSSGDGSPSTAIDRACSTATCGAPGDCSRRCGDPGTATKHSYGTGSSDAATSTSSGNAAPAPQPIVRTAPILPTPQPVRQPSPARPAPQLIVHTVPVRPAPQTIRQAAPGARHRNRSLVRYRKLTKPHK